MKNEETNILESGAPPTVASSDGEQAVAPQPMNPAAARRIVIGEVSRWKGVSVHDHRMEGVAFRVGRRELGHLHGVIADLPFPRCIRDELVAAGRARPHHVLPDSGWVTVPMRTASEVADVIELFRQNYERATGDPSLSARPGVTRLRQRRERRNR